MSGSSSLTGSMGITGDLNVLGNISSSTLSGVGNVTAYSQSVSQSILVLSQSVSSSQYSQDVRLNTLASFTGSYATTGSNTFIGNEIFSGSVRGRILSLSITSNTASMDCSLGNFFTLTLASGSTTRLVPTNINPGETISLKIQQPASAGLITYNSGSVNSLKFPIGQTYIATAVSGATDILTFLSYDNSSLYAVSVKNLS
jgi:hypothetical protein